MRRSSSSSMTTNSAAPSGTRMRQPKRLSSTAKENSHVRVAVRCRPMSAKEIKDGHQSIVEFEHGRKVIVNNIGESPSDQLGTRSGERNNLAQVYEFDAVFDWESTQEGIYNSVCRPIIDGVLEGYNGTIFAYGQTGTGKTYTMEGLGNQRSSSRRASSSSAAGQGDSSASRTKLSKTTESASSAAATLSASPRTKDKSARGVIPRAFKHIFDHISDRKDVQFLVRASYMEIYQEEIHDLLRKDRLRLPKQQQKLKLHERPDTGVYVKDLTSYVCKSMDEIERVMRVGNQNRKVGATDMNEHSSRSHAIFIITIEQQQLPQTIVEPSQTIERTSVGSSASVAAKSDQMKPTTVDGRSSNMIRVGRLNLVDLAGSERQRKTNNSGQRHKESIKINLSLSALGNVINSLMKMNADQQQSSKLVAKTNQSSSAINDTFHVPYRDSKLTRLLQDSLGGNSQTLMIANIGPASYNYDETINTLNYASRAKCIQNRPKLNEDPKDALLRQLQDEIRDIRSRLAQMATEPSDRVPRTADGSGTKRLANEVEQELERLREKLASLEGKLLNGDRSSEGDQLNQRLLEGYTRQQVSELERNRAQLVDQADKEKTIRNELERREEAELEIRQSYSSIQQEVDAKRTLIRQVLLKTKGLRDHLEATQNTYRVELDELDQLQYVLQKELRLKCLIMDNFIPNHHVNQLLPRIVYDERRDTCSVEPIDLPLDYCNLDSGGSSLIDYSDIWQLAETGRIRPQSEMERVSETINPSDARYKYENVLDLRAQQPSFGEPPKVFGANARQAPKLDHHPPTKIHTLIEAALNEHEPDIVI